MSTDSNDINFNVLQLTRSLDDRNSQKWVTEITRVIGAMGGSSLVPNKIGRYEPALRRAGAQLIDEPLDDDMRTGASKRILKMAQDYEVQAIFVHDLELLELGFQLKALTHAPVIFVTQEILNKRGFLAARKLNRQMRDVDHFICGSAYVRDFYHSKFALPVDHLSLIYEGFDLNAIGSEQVSPERTMSLAHSWGAVENVSELILIPAVYRDPIWCESLTAFADEVSKNGQDNVRYIVIGDDDGAGVMSRLENTIYRHARAPIQLAGHCADVEAAVKLTASVLCLNSSVVSQFSEAMIAQALGRYVFLPADCPASDEFIHNGETGSLLPSDPVAIRQAIEGFVKDEPEWRDGHYLSSRSFMMKYFTLDEMHRKLRGLFETA